MVPAMLKPGSARWRLFMFVLSLLLVVIALGVYAEMRINDAEERIERNERQQDQVWCELLDGLDRPVPPTATADQRKFYREIHEIRVGYGCL